MRTPFTLEALRKSKVAGINGHILEQKKQRKPRKVSKHVLWMKAELQEWCDAKGYELKEEYKFHEYRKWKIDFCITELKCGIEYEGIMSEKSRHTSVKGYSGDTDKYREAAKMGITVLRYTVLNYLNVIKDLDELFHPTP